MLVNDTTRRNRPIANWQNSRNFSKLRRHIRVEHSQGYSEPLHFQEGQPQYRLPIGGFVDGAIGTEELGTARNQCIPAGRIIESGLFSIRVGPFSYEIALAHESGNLGCKAGVMLDKGCIRLFRFSN
jgi:hypothetical protein